MRDVGMKHGDEVFKVVYQEWFYCIKRQIIKYVFKTNGSFIVKDYTSSTKLFMHNCF